MTGDERKATPVDARAGRVPEGSAQARDEDRATPRAADGAPLVARRIAFGLVWLKSALVLAVALALPMLGGGQDPAGQAYLYGGFVLGGLYWLAVVLPGWWLASRGTRRGVGLGLLWLLVPDAVLALLAASL